jgi:hypothetical protein
LSKVFEGFLDDGPQFVLRLVVFVLHGIGKENDRGNFKNSMIELSIYKPLLEIMIFSKLQTPENWSFEPVMEVQT